MLGLTRVEEVTVARQSRFQVARILRILREQGGRPGCAQPAPSVGLGRMAIWCSGGNDDTLFNPLQILTPGR
ncbi:MAG: hypothetical protein AMS18_12225 [Gemmatimonas sp. SG8_17]|nr:MAG: hypothetical protein AMS18_12225 [Gemmatimonas sp. SG8_17]